MINQDLKSFGKKLLKAMAILAVLFALVFSVLYTSTSGIFIRRGNTNVSGVQVEYRFMIGKFNDPYFCLGYKTSKYCIGAGIEIRSYGWDV